jgi:MFS family permease
LNEAGAASASDGPVRDSAERSFRWNAGWFIGDYVAFGVGMAFVNQSTVLPTFVSHVTDSTLLIGLIATIQSGAWLIPQVFAAGLVAGRPRKSPYMIAAAAIGRPAYLILALIALALGDRDPTLLLGSLFALMLVFGVADGFVSVPWFDILCRAIPASRRGRLLGAGQVINGIIGIAVGGVVAVILVDPALPFPKNFAVLFALAGAVFMLDLLALALIREPATTLTETAIPRGSVIDQLLPVLRSDRRLVRVVGVRLLFGAGAMIFPFYIVFAGKSLGFGAGDVGLFLSAQVLGGIVGGVLFGQLGDRAGTRATIRAAIPIAALAPGLGLVSAALGPSFGPSLVYVVAGVFVAIGVTFSAYQLGFTNYVLELAPENEHATYAGLYNALVGTLLVVPPLAGWLLQTTSFSVVFALALGFFGLAFIGSLALPEPRRAPAREAA